jgi:hypothetical protein
MVENDEKVIHVFTKIEYACLVTLLSCCNVLNVRKLETLLIQVTYYISLTSFPQWEYSQTTTACK